MIFRDIAATVGNTPLVELARVGKGLPGRVVAKLEMRNPCGSVKDRLSVALIEDAERTGKLRPGMTLIEATEGNTGIGLAFAAAIREYRLVLTMPESMSRERDCTGGPRRSKSGRARAAPSTSSLRVWVPAEQLLGWVKSSSNAGPVCVSSPLNRPGPPYFPAARRETTRCRALALASFPTS